MNWFAFALELAVFLPGVVFVALAAAWLLGAKLTERLVVRATAAAFGSSIVALVALAAAMGLNGVGQVNANLGEWFRVGDYHFPVALLADTISIPMLMLTAVLTGLVGSFSARYMHREEGFAYFFLLLQLFGFGSLLLFAAASFDLMIAGWECVGITSVLLIGFFYQRREPVRNALYVFAVYRTCDLGLLIGVVVLHHFAGSAAISQASRLSGTAAAVAGLLFLFAATGKAAQFPFSGWLPRAMEGPTPSSAIFYGAISVHAGAYLLLRSSALLEHSIWVQAATITIGSLSAIFGVLIGRASADAKGALAYASVTQLGLIFIEIGLGWHALAVWHICGHAIVRTLQFLRAPSALHEFHQMHAAAGGHLDPIGEHHHALLPLRVRLWLYRFAVDRGHMDTLLSRLAVTPVLAFSRLLGGNGGAARPVQAREAMGRSAVAGEADA